MAEESILIFTEFEPDGSEVRRGLGDAVRTAATVASEVAVETLAANMKGFLASLDRIMSASRDQVGGLELEEVQIHLQFDGRGNVGIAAIAGAQISAQGGMRLVLRRPRK